MCRFSLATRPEDLKNGSRADMFLRGQYWLRPGEGSHRRSAKSCPAGRSCAVNIIPGWFDTLGRSRITPATRRNIVAELDWMLDHDDSFSIYMAHGGTTFGFDAGANDPPFKPDKSSYDYDAPISEAGWATPKFYALRELFSKHLNPGEALPDVPPQNPVIQIAPVELDECAPLFDNLPRPKKVAQPQPMELFNQPHGAILYRTQLPAGDAAQLRITELHDYGLIFLDGKKIATLDRRLNQDSARLPARARARDPGPCWWILSATSITATRWATAKASRTKWNWQRARPPMCWPAGRFSISRLMTGNSGG